MNETLITSITHCRLDSRHGSRLQHGGMELINALRGAVVSTRQLSAAGQHKIKTSKTPSRSPASCRLS
jgi:hypothetical protein